MTNEEAIRCQRCGRLYDPPEVISGICGSCADDLRQEQMAEEMSRDGSIPVEKYDEGS